MYDMCVNDSDGLDPIIDSQFSIVSSTNVPHSIDEHQNRYCVIQMDQIPRLQCCYSKLCHYINSIRIYIADKQSWIIEYASDNIYFRILYLMITHRTVSKRISN